MEVEVEVSGTKPSAGMKLRIVDSQHKDQLHVKRKNLQAVFEQCQRALESLDDNSSRGAAFDDDRRQGKGSTSSLADCEADELCNLLKSRVECPNFLQKLQSAQASVPQNIPAEEGNSWDLVSENDLWEERLRLRLRNAVAALSGLALKRRQIELLEMIISNLPLEKSSRPSTKNDDTTDEDDQISGGGLYKIFEMRTNSIESSSRFEGIGELAIERLELHVLANQRFERHNDRFCNGGGQYKFYSVKSTSARS
ncbi:hypothetical protein FF2_020017 [Malus domestica]